MSYIDRDNHLVVHGWMITDLKLKGIKLIVYACIYGFTQTFDQEFTGNLQYLMDWTGGSKQGIANALKSLIEDGFVDKETSETDKRKVKFRSRNLTEIRSRKLTEIENQSRKLTEIGQETLPKFNGFPLSSPSSFPEPLIITPIIPLPQAEESNNTPKLPQKEKVSAQTDSDESAPAAPRGGVSKEKTNKLIIREIIEYLNLKTGRRFNPKAKYAVEHINARLNEGYTIDDFKTVIDRKVRQWKSDSRMAPYLRPETLFGNKFDGYLNELDAPKTYEELKSEIFDQSEWEKTHDIFGNPIEETTCKT